MISSLPDDVLTHILSFLSTKEAIHTCILSKRWSNLWASVPVLKFDFGEFLTYNKPSSDYDVRKYGDKFHRFMNCVLENRAPSRLDTFEYLWLNNDYGYYGDNFLEWLNGVVDSMPRVIKVYIRSNNSLNLPDSVFSCASLQKFTLYIEPTTYSDDDKTILSPRSIDLPSLKVLELYDVELTDDFLQKLFLCRRPAPLESLVLSGCNLGISNITSDVLKELYIEYCWQPREIRISCPSLVSLSIQSYYPPSDISLVNMTSLENAVIELENDSHNNNVSSCAPILDILSGLSNATTIKLHVVLLQLKDQLEKDIPSCRTFNNLKCLEIGEWDMTNEFDLVACFLEHSPNLQELTLHLNEESQGNIKEEIGEVPRVVPFQREYLETVKIFCGGKVKIFSGKKDRLVKILKKHIKSIGKIVLIN